MGTFGVNIRLLHFFHPGMRAPFSAVNMQLQEAIRIALASLWANKLRSVLTLIGVVIGVASVIAVVTLVNGANHYVATKVYGYGADVFTATKTPQVIFDAEEFLKYNKRKNLKMADYEAVAQECTLCKSTSVRC